MSSDKDDDDSGLSSNAVDEDASSESELILNYTNAEDFGDIKTSQLILFYKIVDEDEATFDPEGDRILFEQFAASPYVYSNERSLRSYESLVSRDFYELRIHPNQQATRELAGVQLTPEEAAELLILVYKRKGKRNRFEPTPFSDLNNPDSVPVSVVLFRQYSFEPMARVVPTWHDTTKLGAKFGLLGVRVQDQF